MVVIPLFVDFCFIVEEHFLYRWKKSEQQLEW